MQYKIISLNIPYNGSCDSGYTQMVEVLNNDEAFEHFDEDVEKWKAMVEEKRSTVESDDELLLLWETLGYKVEFIVPDFELSI